MMNCPEFQQHLQDHFDGSDSWDRAELEQHLAACPGCRELHAEARRLEEGLRLLPLSAPPANLADRITMRVRSEQRASRRRLRRLVVGYGLAASLFLAFLLIQYFNRQSRVEPVDAPTQPPVAHVAPSGPQPMVPSLREGMAEVGSAGVAVAKRVTDETVQPIRMFWPDPVPTPGLPGTEVLQQAVDPAAQGVRELTHGVVVVGEPMVKGLRRWGDMVFRQLSTVDGDPKEGL